MKQMKIAKRLKENAVPIHEAIQKCSNWRAAYRDVFQPARSEDILRSFRIPIEDIRSLAAIGEAVAVRAYFALDDDQDFSNIKLMIVPVIPDPAAVHEEKDVLAPNGKLLDETYIFDLTQPCPMLCDKASLLYGGQEPGQEPK
jgi:hypothetical protein